MTFFLRRCLQQLRRWFSFAPPPAKASRQVERRRLGLEALEQRTVPALLALPQDQMGQEFHLDLTGLLQPTLTLHADGSGQFSFANKAGMQLNKGDLLDVTGGRFALVLDLSVGQPLASNMTDTTMLSLDQNGNLQMAVNGQALLVSDLSNIGSLTLHGSEASDNLVISETNGKLLTELGGFTGNAEGSHLNAAMANYLNDAGRSNHVNINFDGGTGAGIDTLRFHLTSMRNVRYVADTSAPNRSGNILVSGANGSLQGGLLLSFANLEPVETDGGGFGATYTVDSTLIAADGDVVSIEDAVGLIGATTYTAGDGFNAVFNTNAAFETEVIKGFGEIEVIVGNGKQIINLKQLDSASTETKISIYSDDQVAPFTFGGKGTGNDTINILAANAGGTVPVDVAIAAADGNDTINIGDATNSLDPILGTVTAKGEAGTDVININDQGDAGPNTYKLTSTTLDRTGAGTISYDTMETFNLNGSLGADTLNVQSTLAGVTYNLLTNGGDDTINVSSDAPTNKGDLAGINGIFNLDAGTGANKLNVSDFAAVAGNSNVVVTATQISGFAGTADGTVLNYQATGGTFSLITLEGSNSAALAEKFLVQSPNGPFILNMNDGADTANVQNLTNPATINGGAGNDTINLSSDAPTNKGNLAGFGADITVDGGGQAGDTLNVSDFAAAAGNANVVISSNKITGFAGAADAQVINFTTIANLNIEGSNTVGETFTIQGPAAKLLLNMNGGSDTANVQSLTNPATVNGGAGDDTINLGNAGNSLDNLNASLTVDGGAAGTDKLNVNDQGDTDPNTYNLLLANTFTRNGAFTLTYTNLEFFTVNAGSASDTFNIAISALTPTTQYLFDGNNPPPPANPGDTVNLDITGVTNARVDLNGIGLFTFGGTGVGLAPIFVDIETFNVVGGDYELFVNLNATVAGSFNGPAGADGAADTNAYQLDGAGKLLQVFFNGQTAYQSNVNAIRAMSIEGSNDSETIIFQENAGRLITEGVQPAIGKGNFQGTATGTNTHLNAPMGNFLGATNNIQINYNGRGGVDAMKFVNTSKRNARYAADLVPPLRSGNISISGPNQAPASNFRLSFSNLAPLFFVGAGGTLTIDSTGIAAANDIYNIDDDATAADQVSIVTSNNAAFEPTQFQGWDEVELFAGDFNQTINFNSLDSKATETKITLRGDDSFLDPTNDGADTINVFTAQAGGPVNVGGTPVNVFVFGNGGNDTINVGSKTNSLDTILGNVTVNGEANDANPTTKFTCDTVSNTLPSGDVLNINDQNDPDNNNYVLSPTTVQRNGTGLITYGTIETLNLNLGSGTNTLTGTTANSVNTFINSQNGNDTITVSSGTTANVQIIGLGGADKITIQATGTNSVTLVFAGDGNDTINIGNATPSLDQILGVICVDGGNNLAAPTIDFTCSGVTNKLPAGDELNFNDTNDNTDNNYILNPADFTRNGFKFAFFSAVETIKLNAGAGNDTIAATTLAGANTFINGGAGNDTISLTSTANANVQVNGNTGSDTITVFATAAGSITLLNGNENNDVFNISPVGGSLDNILGLICVNGGPNDGAPTETFTCGPTTLTLPTGDVLNFNDAGTAAGKTYTFDFDANNDPFLDRNGAARITFTAATIETVNLQASQGDDTISYFVPGKQLDNVITRLNGNAGADQYTLRNGANAYLEANGLAGKDVFTVLTTAATGITQLNGGDNNDTFNIVQAGGSLDNIQGNVCIDGGNHDAGGKTFTCDGTTLTIDTGDVINFNDQGDNTDNTYTLFADKLQRNDMADIAFKNVESINLNTGTGKNTVIVNGLPPTSITIINGSPADDNFTVNATATGSYLEINGFAGKDTFTVKATATNSITQLNGGANNDTFNIVQAGGSLDTIQGVICIDGGTNDAAPTENFKCDGTALTLPTGDVLNLNDDGTATGKTYTFNFDANNDPFLDRTGAARITFAAATIESVNLQASQGNDTVSYFVPGKQLNNVITRLNGNAGADQFTVRQGTNAYLEVNGLAGNDTTTVLSTAASSITQLNGGANNDVFNIVQAGGTLDSIQGVVCVNGGANDAAPTETFTCDGTTLTLPTGDVLNLNDDGTATGKGYTFDFDANNDPFLDRTGAARITFTVATVESINLQASQGNDTVSYFVPGKQLDNVITRLNGNAGADQFTVRQGTNAYLEVNGLAGNDTTTVLSTAANSITQLNGGANNDVFNIVQAGGTLDSIQGVVCVNGGANDAAPTETFTCDGTTLTLPTGDVLNLNDDGTATGKGYTFDFDANNDPFLDRTGAARITFTAATVESINLQASQGNDTVSYFVPGKQLDNVITRLNGNGGADQFTVRQGTNAYLEVNGLAGNDTMTVLSTAASSITQLNGGANNDVFNIVQAGGTLDSIQGVVCVNGGTNDATLDPRTFQCISTSFKLPIGDILNLNDDGTATGKGYTFDFDANNDPFLDRTGAARITFTAATIETVNLNASQGNDTVSYFTTGNQLNNVIATLNMNAGDDVVTLKNGTNAYLEVNGSTGKDTMNVIANAAGGITQLNGGNDNDTFNIGSDPVNTANSTLDPILGAICVDGGDNDKTANQTFTCANVTVSVAGGDVLNLNDAGDTSDNTYTLSSTLFNRNGTDLVQFNNVETVNLNAGKGNNKIIVNGTVGTGSSITRINGGPGNDTITASNTAANSYLEINGFGGKDTLNVLATAAGSITQVNGGANNDTINIGSDPVNTANSTLNNILGPICVNGGEGDEDAVTDSKTCGTTTVTLKTGDVLNFNDAGTATGKTYTFDFAGADTFLDRTGAARIVVQAVNGDSSIETLRLDASQGNDTINYFNGTTQLGNVFAFLLGNGGTDTFNVKTGATGLPSYVQVKGLAANDTVNVLASTAGSITEVFGGTGSDTVNVGSLANSLDPILGVVCVRGSDGGANDAGAVDVLNVNDQGDNDIDNTYAITDKSVQRTDGPVAIFYNETGVVDVETLNVRAGQKNDTITITGISADTTVTANTGNDVITINKADAAGKFLVVNGQDGTDSFTVNATGVSTVTITGDAGSDTVTLNGTGTGAFTANGGADNDVFCIQSSAASTPGTVTLTGDAGADGFFFRSDANGANAELGNGSIDGGSGATDTTLADFRGTVVFKLPNQMTAGISLKLGAPFPNVFKNDLISYQGWNKATNGLQGTKVDLVNQTASGLGGGKITNVENITGSNFNDVLIGTEAVAGNTAIDNGSNLIYGLGGNDWIDGRSGKDALFGDGGTDLVIGGLGQDYIDGGDEGIAGQNPPLGDLLFGDKFTLSNGGDVPSVFLGTINPIDLYLVPNGGLKTGFSAAVGAGSDLDTLRGGRGRDAFFGGPGFDTFLIDSCGDVCLNNPNSDRFFEFGPGSGTFQLFRPGDPNRAASNLAYLLLSTARTTHPNAIDTNPLA